MHTKLINRDQYEDLASAMMDKHETREGGIVLVSGIHEELGHTVLRREVGVFSVEAEEVILVSGHGTIV